METLNKFFGTGEGEMPGCCLPSDGFEDDCELLGKLALPIPVRPGLGFKALCDLFRFPFLGYPGVLTHPLAVAVLILRVVGACFLPFVD